MKMTIESTTKIVQADGVACRVWEGVTERGSRVQVLIPRIALLPGQNQIEFETELEEQQPPSPDVQAFPLSMIL